MFKEPERKAQCQKEKKKEIVGACVLVQQIKAGIVFFEGQEKVLMSKKYPECPTYDHSNCKELEKLDVCAIVREDKKCLKKRKKSGSKK